jgi:hypothetical protein
VTADFGKPVNSDAVTGVLEQLRDNIDAVAALDTDTASSKFTGMLDLDRSTNSLRSWNGSSFDAIATLLEDGHFESVFTQIWGGSAGGSANARTVSLPEAPDAYYAGLVVLFSVASANTAAMTLDVNSLGPVSVLRWDGSALESGDISGVVAVVHNGTHFRTLTGKAGLSSTAFVPQARTITAGDGLSGGGDLSANRSLAVDSTVVRTTGTQTIAGAKTISSALTLSTAGTSTGHAVRADRTITAGDGLSGGGNLTANRSLAVDSTVVRTSGNQTIAGTKTFSSQVNAGAGLDTPVISSGTNLTMTTSPAGVIVMTWLPSNTTASAANVRVNLASGELLASTSLRAAKKDIKPLEQSESRKLLSLKPSTFKSACKGDDDRTLLGLIAEEVAESCPLLAEYDENGVLKGVQYERVAVGLLALVQEMHSEIKLLKEQVQNLRGTK